MTGFIILMSLVLAYFIQFTDLMGDRMTDNKKIILVIILVSYAIYRSFRLYKMMINNKRNDENEI
jgi:hypothetical protein